MSTSTSTSSEPTYTAFISYRHKPLDSAVAKAIHRQIETYRVPAHIAKDFGKKRLEKVFRDQDELPLMEDLGEGIRQALRNSEWFILVCSPDTPQSKWCMAEVDYFIELGKRDKILTVLVAGEPDDSFPKQLRYKEVDGIMVESEPLAADVRASTDAASVRKVRSEKLRLLAPMLGVGYDDLKRRQRERKLKQLVGASIAIALLSLGAGAYVFNQNAIVSAERDAALISQSQYLAGVSAEKLAAGDPATAALLALDALPQNLDKPERPLVDEAVVALRNARASQIQGEYTLTGGVSQPFFVNWQYLEKDRVLTYYDNGSQYYYHMPTGKLIGQTDEEFIAHSPENSLIATAGSSNQDFKKSFMLYSLDSLSKPVLEIEEQDYRCRALFAAQGRYLLSYLTRVSDDTSVELFETSSGESLLKILASELFPTYEPESFAHPYLNAVALSADGKQLALGIGSVPEGAAVVEIYDTSSKRKSMLQERQNIDGKDVWWLKEGAYNLEFSPDGLQLCVVDTKGGMHLFDTASGEHRFSLNLKKGVEDVQSYQVSALHAEFSANGTWLAVWIPGEKLEVYSTDTGKLFTQSDSQLGSVDYAGYTLDNTLIYHHASSIELVVLPLDNVDLQYRLTIPDLLFDPVVVDGMSTNRGIIAHADGVTAVSRRGTYQLWEHKPSFAPTSSEAEVSNVAPAFDIVRFGAIALEDDTARVFSPDGTRFAVSNNSIISIYDTRSLERLAVVEQETAEPWVSVFHQSNELPRTQQLLWLPDGKRLLSTSVIGGVRVIDAKTGAVLHVWESEYTSSPFATLATVSPDGRFFALNNPSYLGGMYDLDSYEKLYDFPRKTENDRNDEALSFVCGCCFSPDSTRFYFGTTDALVAIDPLTGTQLMELSYKPAYGMAISPDGTKLAFGGGAPDRENIKSFFIVDIQTGEELLDTDVEVGIWGTIAWSPDGSLVAASATNDELTTIWSGETGDIVRVFDGYDPQFSSDSQFLLVGGIPAVGVVSEETSRGCTLYDIQSGRSFLELPALGILSPDDSAVLMQNTLWYKKPLEVLMAEARLQLAGRELTSAERQEYYQE
ncbi:MAG: TIR domain-containing protein [Coriobacteriales bacterium]|jgi:WD40 repeat protein|nr:TIR domain-containing protein [Coriobacteriales bacterium]